ncbi:similar to Saccharomyces cerevisiae YMR009W ADI1 Acireductone dioxygenease involved in the methionine salvage pathway [Maudiozyma saulgeensis]|uniref:Acireductone dioxygenase n=1 Tax=Maudiozyma saulgeensis TaxID=1789683 RepID=A0A1X7R8A2_9SACH|nr:similar to Saccharomyces cerevisiae YMR009W ADI1 Acireductone dioxygenease involved in the methionine salvage pathway [Kazachstania saulgeensis]
MVKAYVHDNNNSVDAREAHDTGVPVTLERLEKLGVIYKYLETQPDVESLAKERNYKNQDTVNIQLSTFGNDENLFQKKLAIFYEEHLHDDEEIRYCLEGTGYFDIRDSHNNEWIRCKVDPGDLLIVPAGIYHRFALDITNYIKALRLFKDEPKWEAINKSSSADESSTRKAYLQSIV